MEFGAGIFVPDEWSHQLAGAAAVVASSFDLGPLTICEIGTGSAVVAVSLAGTDGMPEFGYLGIDLSLRKLQVAKRNIERVGTIAWFQLLAADLEFGLPLQSDLDGGLLLLANLPQIVSAQPNPDRNNYYTQALETSPETRWAAFDSRGLRLIRLLIEEFNRLARDRKPSSDPIALVATLSARPGLRTCRALFRELGHHLRIIETKRILHDPTMDITSMVALEKVNPEDPFEFFDHEGHRLSAVEAVQQLAAGASVFQDLLTVEISTRTRLSIELARP